MSEEEYLVECGNHGTAQATFVCRHLVDGEDKNWYSSEPDHQEPYPDAWCGKCHIHFEKEGEWSHSAEEVAGGADTLKILCCNCYSDRKKQCNVHYI